MDSSTQTSAGAELPRYVCHKKVWALKIKDIFLIGNIDQGITGGAEIVPEDSRYAPFDVDASYIEKHKPTEGGYYVVYDDGYKSFSPAKAFEDGYTRL